MSEQNPTGTGEGLLPIPGESPIERRAMRRVKRMPGMQEVLLSQLRKGHLEYGGPIDDCGYTRPRLVRATAEEGVDFVVYLEALTCPQDVMEGVLKAVSWLEGEL